MLPPPSLIKVNIQIWEQSLKGIKWMNVDEMDGRGGVWIKVGEQDESGRKWIKLMNVERMDERG